MRVSGFLAGFGVTIIWSSWMIATRLGLSTNLSVTDLLTLRLLVGSLVAVPVLIYLKSWKGLSLKQYAVLGFFGGLPHNFLAYEALQRTTVAHSSVFLYAVAPIATAVVGYLYQVWRFGLTSLKV